MDLVAIDNPTAKRMADEGASPKEIAAATCLGAEAAERYVCRRVVDGEIPLPEGFPKPQAAKRAMLPLIALFMREGKTIDSMCRETGFNDNTICKLMAYAVHEKVKPIEVVEVDIDETAILLDGVRFDSVHVAADEWELDIWGLKRAVMDGDRKFGGKRIALADPELEHWRRHDLHAAFQSHRRAACL